MQFDIRHIEQVTGTDDLLGRNTHHGDTGRVAANLGSPEAEQLLVLLDTIAGDGSRRPLKVVNTLDLDRCLVQEVHVGQLVDRDRLTLEHARHVLLIRRPLESGPLHLLLGRNLTLVGGTSGQIVRHKRTEGLSGLNIPNNDVLAIFLVGQDGLAFLDLNGARGPGGQVAFQRREFDELDEGVGELFLLGEGGTTPKLDTLGVDGGEEGTLGGPLDEELCPVCAVDDVLWRVRLVVPEHTDLIVAVKGELITGAAISHPRAQVLLLLERLNLGLDVFILNATFTTIALDIHQLVHGKGVLLVEGDTVQLLDGGDGLFGSLVLNESESIYHNNPISVKIVPPQI